MTRADNVRRYLSNALDLPDEQIDATTTDVMHLADDRQYMSLGDVAHRTGRNKSTLMSWIARNQHNIPHSIGNTNAGLIWDAADWDQWCEDHPLLLDKTASA